MNKQTGIRLLGLLVLAMGATAQAHDGNSIRVMTQNLYIGADVTNIATTTDFSQLPMVVNQVYSKVLASDFPARARAFADKVRQSQPDAIGLQEVSLIRIQDQSDFFQGNPTLATQVKLDYLQIILDDLAADGLHYKVAGVVNDVDHELPGYGDVTGDGIPELYDLRLTDRDVILVRDKVDVSNVTPIHYSTNLSYPTPAGTIVYNRGAIAVDARVHGQTYRLVNTHLEVRFNDTVALFQAAQFQELMAYVGGTTHRLVIMGDMNNMPTDVPDNYLHLPTPYQQSQYAGLTDIWLNGGQGDGYTCCHSEMLDNLSEQQTQRIDYIFVRSASGELPFSQVGKSKARTVSGITSNNTWYSDHDGVYAHIIFAPEERHEGKGDND